MARRSLGLDAGSVGEAAAKVKRLDYFVPALGKGAEMLHGSREENVERSYRVDEGQRRAEIMARIFAYLIHKGGVVDDSAAELVGRRKERSMPPLRLRPSSPAPVRSLMPFAKVCAAAFAEVWKISNESLAYPNAELVRQALVKVLPPGSIVLVAHDHFGLDLSPGLAIKMNSAFASDVVDIEGIEGSYSQTGASGVRRRR